MKCTKVYEPFYHHEPDAVVEFPEGCIIPCKYHTGCEGKRLGRPSERNG